MVILAYHTGMRINDNHNGVAPAVRKERNSVRGTRETMQEFLNRGGRVQRVASNVSAHLYEWDGLVTRIDCSPEPYCADVTVSAWSVGSDIAATVQEFRSEREQ
jgi:hypothetical protein